jgi:hypothetical protein
VSRSWPAFVVALLLACPASEAPRVELPVVVDGSGLAPSTSSLGWAIELDEARVAISGIRFTTAGEVHDELRPSASVDWLLGLLIPTANAHPGHAQGGEIIGELPGNYVLDFIDGDGEALGLARLIVGSYTAADFGLARASAAELGEGDPLLGHTAILRGVATSPIDPEYSVSFSIVIDSPLDRELVGAPFIYEVREDRETILDFRLLGVDPVEGDQLFDGIDFALLDQQDGADGVVTLVDPDTNPGLDPALADAYNQIRREFQTHDLFEILPRDP